jgi:hypothetical protein
MPMPSKDHGRKPCFMADVTEALGGKVTMGHSHLPKDAQMTTWVEQWSGLPGGCSYTWHSLRLGTNISSLTFIWLISSPTGKWSRGLIYGFKSLH